MTDPQLDALAAALAGQYDVQQEIGRGGMGVVYLARDLKLDRTVAIKTLPPQLAGDPVVRERFVREARTAAALSHPGIVPIHRADEIDGQVFFVMGYVEGESLAERVQREGRVAPSEVRQTVAEVARALGYAHARGVIHRDVKAENILLDVRDGRAVVTDFGIARLAEAAPLTSTGQILGTVHYLSPEQVAGERIDGRSDLYSLGVVAYFALAGRFPFEAELASAVLVAHVTRPAPLLRSVAPDVPASLAAIVDRLLAKEPPQRFADGAALAAALDAIATDVMANETTTPRERPVLPTRTRGLVSETEAQAMWQRAAELQDATGAIPSPVPTVRRDTAADAGRTSGYAVGSVRDAAREAGIATQFIDRAMAERGLAPAGERLPAPATEVLNRSRRGAAWFTGGPHTISLEAVVEGEVPEEEYDQFADIIRRRLGEIGALSIAGKSLTWQSLDMRQRRVHLSMSSRRGRTTIMATENLRQMMGGLFGGIIGGGGGGGGGAALGATTAATHNPLLGFAVWGGCVVGAYGVARTIFRSLSRSRERTLEELVGELAAAAELAIATANAGVPRLRG